MALHQERMIRVLDSATRIVEHARLLSKIAANTRINSPALADANYFMRKAIEEKDFDLMQKACEAALNAFRTVVDQVTDIQIPMEAVEAIAEERAHFAATSRRNETSARAMRNLRRRRAEGNAPEVVRRATRAQYEAWNRGETTIDGDEVNNQEEDTTIDPNDSDPDATARDKELVERDAALAEELTKDGLF